MADRKYKKAMKIGDQKLDNVAGGVAGDEGTFHCPSCHVNSMFCHRTGNTETRYLFFTYYEWECERCGRVFWVNWEDR